MTAPHLVTVDADGWHIAHPVTCDLDEDCPFDGAAQGWSDPPAAGVYPWHDWDGQLGPEISA